MDQRNSINNVKLKKIKIVREKLFIISLMLLGLLSVSSCSNEDDNLDCKMKLRSTQVNPLSCFKIEGNCFRINSAEDLSILEEALSKIECHVTTQSLEQAKKQNPNLMLIEKMAPSEESYGTPSRLPDLWCSFYARPVCVFRGDPAVYMETQISIDGPSVYQKEGWVVTKNIATWKDNNTKVDYLVEGILFVKYQVTYKNPTTQKDTVDIKHLYKTIRQTGTYNY